jgi:hypothetical protein
MIADPTTIDTSLRELHDGAKRWIALSPAAKAALLDRIREKSGSAVRGR